jgi:hypothetical protein
MVFSFGSEPKNTLDLGALFFSGTLLGRCARRKLEELKESHPSTVSVAKNATDLWLDEVLDEKMVCCGPKGNQEIGTTLLTLSFSGLF